MGRTATKPTKERAEKEKAKIDKAIEFINSVDSIPVDELPNYYRCVRCGRRQKSVQPSNTIFYSSSISSLFKGNGNNIPVCKDCLNEIYKYLAVTYHDRRIAMATICALGNFYFNDEIFERVIVDEDFTVGKYFQRLNVVWNKTKDSTFADYVADLYQKAARDLEDVREDASARWKDHEKINKRRVTKALGYEPFTDKGYEDDELRFLYNTAASYLTDGIEEDNHKLQQIVVLSKALLDVERMSRRITERFSNRESDTKTTKDLVDMRNSTIKIINDIAAENGISAKSKGEKKTTTLTGIMNEMLGDGVDEIKVNVVDAKMSKSYEEIAKANAKALIDELNITSDDYARLVSEQSEMIATLQKKIETITERLRLTTIELKQKESEVGELQTQIKGLIDNADNH